MESAPLNTCSRILDRSTATLQNSNKMLQTAIEDVARLNKVLSIQKVFGLVPEQDIEAAKKAAQKSSHPQVKQLSERIHAELERLTRRRDGLKNKSELQRIRLDTAEKNVPELRAGTQSKIPASESQIARLRVLQNKKDRLKYSLSRLKLQQTRTKLSSIPALPPS